MTVVAYKDGIIAADSGFTHGAVYKSGRMKIARNGDGWLAGHAGTSSTGDRFKEWFLAGMPQPSPFVKDDDVEGIIVRPDGLVQVHDFNGHSAGHYSVDVPYFAIGSGSEVALGAMHAGATAMQAILAAIEHGVNCGGKVVYFNRDIPNLQSFTP